MAKVDLYDLQTTVLGTHRLYLFDQASKQDFQVTLSEVMGDLLGSAAFLDAGTSPGDLVALDADSRIPLGLLPPEIIEGAGGGSGDVVGPASVADGRVALFDGTTGKLLKQSAQLLGTAAWLNVGTGASQIVQLDGSGRLPAVDGSQLTNLPSGSGDVVGPESVADNEIALFDGTTGLLLKGGGLLGTAASADTGTGEGNVPVLDADGLLDPDVIPTSGVFEPATTYPSWSSLTMDLGTDPRQLHRVPEAGSVLTIRAQADVDYPDHLIASGTAVYGLTITPASGVTLNGGEDALEVSAEEDGGTFSLLRLGEDEWFLARGGNAGGLTPETLAETLEASVPLTTGDSPVAHRAGAAIGELILTQAAASVKSWWNALLYRIGLYGAAFTSAPTAGDLVIVGTADGNIQGLETVPVLDVEQTPDTWPHANEDDGLIEYLTDAEAVAQLRNGLPLDDLEVPVAGVLSYDADQNPNAYLEPISAKLWLNKSIFGTLNARAWRPSKLIVPTDGSARDIDIGNGTTQDFPSTGCDIFLRDLTNVDTLPFTIPADSISVWELGKHRLGKPYLRLLDIGYEASAATVSYLGVATPTSGTVGTRTLSAAAIGSHQAGDMLVFIAFNTGNATTPNFDGTYTTVAGIGADGIQGTITVAWKIAGSSAETGTAFDATQLHCVRVRKTGGATPQVQATVRYDRAASFSSVTSAWGALTATNAGLIIGGHGFLSTDDYGTGSPLRSEFGSPIYEFRTSSNTLNLFVLGVAENIAAATAWGSTTTDKDGGVGKDSTFALAVY